MNKSVVMVVFALLVSNVSQANIFDFLSPEEDPKTITIGPEYTFVDAAKFKELEFMSEEGSGEKSQQNYFNINNKQYLAVSSKYIEFGDDWNWLNVYCKDGDKLIAVTCQASQYKTQSKEAKFFKLNTMSGKKRYSADCRYDHPKSPGEKLADSFIATAICEKAVKKLTSN